MVLLPLESLNEVVDILIEVLLILLSADAVNAIRRILADVAPTLFEKRLIEQLVEVAEPMLGLRLGLFRYSLQEGLHCVSGPPCPVNEPVQATYACQPLPPLSGPTVSEYYELV